MDAVDRGEVTQLFRRADGSVMLWLADGRCFDGPLTLAAYERAVQAGAFAAGREGALP